MGKGKSNWAGFSLNLPPNSPAVVQSYPSSPPEGISNAVLRGHIWNRGFTVCMPGYSCYWQKFLPASCFMLDTSQSPWF